MIFFVVVKGRKCYLKIAVSFDGNRLLAIKREANVRQILKCKLATYDLISRIMNDWWEVSTFWLVVKSFGNLFVLLISWQSFLFENTAILQAVFSCCNLKVRSLVYRYLSLLNGSLYCIRVSQSWDISRYCCITYCSKYQYRWMSGRSFFSQMQLAGSLTGNMYI